MKQPTKIVPTFRIVFWCLTLVLSSSLYTMYLSPVFAQASYSHNSFAIADYCTLENNTTVIYGWAHDPDAPAGAQPYLSMNVGGVTGTTASDRAGYRDATINQYINAMYPGMPTSSVYGWRFVAGSLFKGGSYSVSGTVLNYGSGANTALSINSGHYVDNDSSKPYFAGGKIPEACLATKPVAAPTAPNPVVTPRKTTPSPTATTPIATPVSSANAAITTGTKSTTLKIPTDNATNIKIIYGTSLDKLNKTSSEVKPTGADSNITLEGLSAKTTYIYQIVRTLNGQSVNSPVATFTTSGYVLSLHFSENSKGVSGIKTTLQTSKSIQTSDKNGNVEFSELSDGSYKVTYTYKGKTHSLTYSSSKANVDENKSAPLVIKQTIYLDSSATTTLATTKTKSNLPLILITCSSLALSTFIVWWLLRRRGKNKQNSIAPMSGPFAATYVPPVVQPATPENRHSRTKKKRPAVANSETDQMHIGVSLRDLVMQSMAEEAAKRKQTPGDKQ